LTVAYNSFSVLTLEGTHYRNEQQCVNSRSQCLVQDEFLGRVGLAEPFLSIDICRICRKLLFQVLLPQNVQGTAEEIEQHKMHDRHNVKDERLLAEVLVCAILSWYWGSNPRFVRFETLC
jgi:hypothetical protein